MRCTRRLSAYINVNLHGRLFEQLAQKILGGGGSGFVVVPRAAGILIGFVNSWF